MSISPFFIVKDLQASYYVERLGLQKGTDTTPQPPGPGS